MCLRFACPHQPFVYQRVHEPRVPYQGLVKHNKCVWNNIVFSENKCDFLEMPFRWWLNKISISCVSYVWTQNSEITMLSNLVGSDAGVCAGLQQDIKIVQYAALKYKTGRHCSELLPLLWSQTVAKFWPKAFQYATKIQSNALSKLMLHWTQFMLGLRDDC